MNCHHRTAHADVRLMQAHCHTVHAFVRLLMVFHCWGASCDVGGVGTVLVADRC
jgi:hypothetical protein